MRQLGSSTGGARWEGGGGRPAGTTIVPHCCLPRLLVRSQTHSCPQLCLTMAVALRAVPACAQGERSSLAAPSAVYRAAWKPFKPAVAAPARRWRSLRPGAALSVDQQPPAATSRDRSHETDVVIIGSGIGGGWACHRRRRQVSLLPPPLSSNTSRRRAPQASAARRCWLATASA